MRLRVQGGYTRYMPDGKVVWWTCGHEGYGFGGAAQPTVDCPYCHAMTDEALDRYVKEKNLTIEPLSPV